MIYTITRKDEKYLEIPERIPALNVSDSNFAEVATFEDLYRHCSDDTIGIEHSRRFFGSDEPYKESFLKETLNDYKAIVCPFYNRGYVNCEMFMDSHHSNKFNEAIELTANEHPEMAGVLNNVYYSNFLTIHNMIYTTKDIFKQYIDFLNDTLFKYQLTDENDAKLNAHLAERYQTIFLLQNFKISELGFINVTCYSKDLSRVVNNVNGLDFT